MRSHPESPHWLRFYAVAHSFNLDDSSQSKNVMEVMVRALICKTLSVPPAARESILLASQFLEGRATASQLDTARVAMWHLIEGHNCDFKDPAVCAIRAVICGLSSPAPNYEPHETLSFFLDMWDGAQFEPELAANAMTEIYGVNLD